MEVAGPLGTPLGLAQRIVRGLLIGVASLVDQMTPANFFVTLVT